MHKVLVRTVSGVIYIALIVGCIFGGSAWFISLMAVFSLAGVVEFQKVSGVVSRKSWAAMTAFELDCVASVAIVYMSCLEILPSWVEICIIGVLMLYALVRFTLALYDKSTEAFRNTTLSVMSLFYIAVPLLLLSLVYSDHAENHLLVLAVFIMIWLNDTGAFCVGTLLGRHRLFERLSPKKSWEGFVGGFVLSIVSGLVFDRLMPEVGYSQYAWMALGAVVSVLSTWGDLFESMLKRSCHVKDSGHIMPGHGGILDRIDSLLFVSIGLFIFNLMM
ncbi:MAG: phosphatidate cytidylyltransferase [Muribaculaceae bacterium]|nr:phosphatidate cytidylyltransferase [Muribaculaceae bacterium]